MLNLDFGEQYTGQELWLELQVRQGGGSYTKLSPRQPLSATPYALGLRPGAVVESSGPAGFSVITNDAQNQIAVYGEANQDGSVAVYGNSQDNTGVFGNSSFGRGVWGQSTNSEGVYGYSTNGIGVRGETDGDGSTIAGVLGVGNGYDNWGVGGIAVGSNGIGVFGSGITGVYGESFSGKGVHGKSTNSWGVIGRSTNQEGAVGVSDNYDGVRGTSYESNRAGVYGHNHEASGIGVRGQADAAGGVGVYGSSVNNTAVYGNSTHSTAVWGESTNRFGVFGESYIGIYAGVIGVNNTTDGVGVNGEALGAGGVGVYGNNGGSSTGSWAGYFNGRVTVAGSLSKSGGSFTIDHPLDPENHYLQHSFVESPDMMNVYNGNIILDEAGEAWVMLPDYFEALNQDFRYQLTAVGAPGPNIYIAETVQDNQFKIAGGTPGMTVSWQITGIRHDPWAEANRIEVELPKDEADQGLYLHPEVYDLPREAGISAKLEAGHPAVDGQQPASVD